MGYKKHIATKHRGDFFEAFLCLCPRQKDHEVERPVRTEQPALFDWTDETMAHP